MYKKLIYNLDGQGVGTFSANVYIFFLGGVTTSFKMH